MSTKTEQLTVESYFSALPEESRSKLQELRNIITKYLPEGTVEVISYQMPTYKYKGKALVGIAGFKQHVSYFPYSGVVMDKLDVQLTDYKTSTGTLQFKFNQEIPEQLIEKMIEIRLVEIEESL